MARRRSLGAPTTLHADRAAQSLREAKRLAKLVRSNLKSPPDCERAARLAFALNYQMGAHDIDQIEGEGRLKHRAKRYTGAILDRFVKACVVAPKSPTAARRMRAVWRRTT